MSDKEQALDGGASFLHAAPGVCPVNGKRKSQSQKLQKGLANVFFAFDNITLILIVALCCVAFVLNLVNHVVILWTMVTIRHNVRENVF